MEFWQFIMFDQAAYRREYYLRNREKHLQTEKDRYQKDKERIKSRRRAYYRANRPQLLARLQELKYGRTVPDDATCEVCGKPNQRGNKREALCNDHNHLTGHNRGFLCHSCNRALGLLKEDRSRILKLDAYLRKYEVN
jgi:hypothetical protein